MGEQFIWAQDMPSSVDLKVMMGSSFWLPLWKEGGILWFMVKKMSRIWVTVSVDQVKRYIPPANVLAPQLFERSISFPWSKHLPPSTEYGIAT